MAHMIPEYVKTQKWNLTKPNGDEEIFDDVRDAGDYIDKHATDKDDYVITCARGWFARLSAPGYLDCTEWGGPFDTAFDARQYIVDTYDVDATTGDEL
jgi:hypothetical protein